MASLGFKRENLIKILESGSKIPFTSPFGVGLPSPKFKSWWSDIRECVRDFGENGAQQVDVPHVFQGDLTLKLLIKAKLSGTKRKRNVKVSSVKKSKVHIFFSMMTLFL